MLAVLISMNHEYGVLHDMEVCHQTRFELAWISRAVGVKTLLMVWYRCLDTNVRRLRHHSGKEHEGNIYSSTQCNFVDQDEIVNSTLDSHIKNGK